MTVTAVLVVGRDLAHVYDIEVGKCGPVEHTSLWWL